MLHRHKLNGLAQEFAQEYPGYVYLSQFVDYIEDNSNGTIISRCKAAHLLRMVGYQVRHHFRANDVTEALYCRIK